MFSHALASILPVLALATSLAFAGNESVEIVGGTNIGNTNPDGASTVAIVIDLGKGQAICTGSILATDIIVTAAHCVKGLDGKTVAPQQLTLVFGLDIRASNRLLVRATGVVANPQYNPSASKDANDIAIIRFITGLPPGYIKATLLPSATKIPNGAPAVLIGYGVNTMANGGSGEGILREANVTIANGAFAKTEVLVDQRNGKGACHGDSGGPAFARSGTQLLLWGVTNRGNPDNAPDDCTHYSVYTRITAQSAFINSAARALRTPTSFASR
jgi:secreted trypsin-like serine protease